MDHVVLSLIFAPDTIDNCQNFPGISRFPSSFQILQKQKPSRILQVFSSLSKMASLSLVELWSPKLFWLQKRPCHIWLWLSNEKKNSSNITVYIWCCDFPEFRSSLKSNVDIWQYWQTVKNSSNFPAGIFPILTDFDGYVQNTTNLYVQFWQLQKTIKTFDKDDFCKSLPFQDGVCVLQQWCCGRPSCSGCRNGPALFGCSYWPRTWTPTSRTWTRPPSTTPPSCRRSSLIDANSLNVNLKEINIFYST